MDLQQVLTALKNADAAGDTAAATELARIARSMGGSALQPPPPATQRSFGEAALDIPAAALSGLGGLLQFPGQLVKLVPGLTDVGEVLEKPGELVSGAGQALKSEGLKAREALRSKAISEAEKDGILSSFATAITSTIKDPALITTFVAEQVPLLLGPLGAAKVAQKIGAKSIESAGVGLTGAAAEEAVKAAAQRVSRTAYGAAYGTGAAMQAADVSSDAYDEAYQKAIEKSLPEEEALRLAANAGRVAGAGAGVTALLAQRLPGARAIEQRLAGVPGTAGKLGAAVGESIGEAVEEGGGQVFKNLGLRQVDPEQPLLEGVGGAAGLGALGGGLLGGVLGKKAPEERFEGQREGETDREFAARLQREIAAGLRPPEPEEPPAAPVEPTPPAGPALPGGQQLLTLAAQPNGYGMLENLKQRLIADESIPQEQKTPVIDNISNIQGQITPEPPKEEVAPEVAAEPAVPGVSAQEMAARLRQLSAALGKSGALTGLEHNSHRSALERMALDLERGQSTVEDAFKLASAPIPDEGYWDSRMKPTGQPNAPEVQQYIDEANAGLEAAKAAVLAPPSQPPAVPEKVVKVEGPKPKAMPMRAKELPQPPAPVSEESKAEAAERKQIDKEIRKAEMESRKVARESKSLWGQLIGQLDPKEVSDISPDRRFGPLNKKGGGGFFLDYFVDSGLLDEYLPPNMRHNSGSFDSAESQEYIKDILRRGEPSGYITWSAKQKITQNDISIEQMEQLLKSLNTDEINAQLQEIYDERRREEDAAREVQVPAARGEGATAEERTGAEAERKSIGAVKGEVREVPPEIQGKIDTLKKVLKKNLAKYGLKDVDLNLEQGMADEGSFSGQLIRIALDAPDPLGILRHESIHALKEAGFFTGKQWTTLEKMADQKWIDQYLKRQQTEYEGQRMSRFDAYMKAYGGNMDLIREEAISDAFRNFSKKKPAGLMGVLTERMKNFFKAVKESFTSQGIESADEIFGKVEEGKLKAATAKAEGVERKSLRAPDTEAFKKWFGDSKVVDENGEPMVMYHGTTADFDVFDTTRRAIAGEGSFFSASPMGSFAAGVGGNIMPVYLSIKNPKVIDLARESDDVFKDRFIKQGHDGVVMMFEGKIQTAVAFYPEQIKSAIGNIGTFDPTSPDIRKSLRTPADNIVDLTRRRTQQLREEFERENEDVKEMMQNRQRREDLRFLVEEASPFFKSVVNQVQLAREVYDLAPMVQTDIRPALYKYDRMWKNYMTAVYGDDSTMYGSPFEEKAQNSTFLATSNLRPDIKDADEFKSEINAYLQEATDYANSLSNRSPRQKEFKKELLDVLNRPVVKVKFSLRSMPTIDPAAEARVNDTIRPRKREGFVDRMIDALSAKAFSRFREELINHYNEFAEVDKRVAAQIRSMGGVEQMADERAETAALFSDQAAAVASSALGAHNRKGGIPVYKNGVVTVDTSGDNEGPVVIFAPLASTGDPRTFQHYQFWAAVNRAKKYIQNPGQTRYVEQTFDQADIDLAEQLRIDYENAGIDFKDIQKRWNKYNNGLVKLMRDTGTISDRAARDFMEHGDYFPFYRQVNEEEMTGPKTFSTIAGTKPPKAAKGSEEPLGDFFETVVRNTQAAVTLAMKNVAAQRATSQALRIDEVVRLSENPQVVQASGNTWNVFDSQYADTISAADQSGALAAAQNKYGANATVDASATPGKWNVFKPVKIGEVDAVNAQEAKQIANENYKYRPDVFVYKVLENGQPVYYRAYDIKFINALKALNTTDLPFIGLLSAPANLLRTLVTKEPGYMLVNQMRDSLSAWVTSGVKLTPIVDSARQFAKSISKNSPEMEALFNAGVIGGYEYAHGMRESGEFLEKEIRQKAGVKSVTEKVTAPFTSLWGALERGTQVSDGATRAEVYKRVLEETGNEAEALWQAAEVLNFYRHGRSPVIRVLTAAVPFLNSRIQGLDVLYRAGLRPALDKLSTDEQRQRMKTFWVRGMTMMALSSMYWMLTHDDEEYKKQEQETRDNYWLIPSLGIKIAIPFEVGVLFKVLPERILANVFGDDTGRDTLESLKRQLESTLMFTIIPQAIAPYIEVTRNFSSFTQRPIIGQGLEGVAPQFQVAPGTSSLSQLLADKLAISTTEDSSSFTKALAKELEISPVKLDHLIKGYTGTIGQYAVDLFDAIYNLNADVPKPSKRFEQLPIIKRLALDPDARGTVTAYYDFKNSVDEVVRTSNLLERTMKPEEYAEYVSKNAGILANRDYILSLEKTMKEFREMKNLVRNSEMDADEKRDLILTITQVENDLTANIREVRSLSSK